MGERTVILSAGAMLIFSVLFQIDQMSWDVVSLNFAIEVRGTVHIPEGQSIFGNIVYKRIA